MLESQLQFVHLLTQTVHFFAHRLSRAVLLAVLREQTLQGLLRHRQRVLQGRLREREIEAAHLGFLHQHFLRLEFLLPGRELLLDLIDLILIVSDRSANGDDLLAESRCPLPPAELADPIP